MSKTCNTLAAVRKSAASAKYRPGQILYVGQFITIFDVQRKPPTYLLPDPKMRVAGSNTSGFSIPSSPMNRSG